MTCKALLNKTAFILQLFIILLGLKIEIYCHFYGDFVFVDFFNFINWRFHLFTFQILSPFTVSLLQIHYAIPPLPCFYEGAPLPTYPLLLQHPSIHLHWGIKPSQDQGTPLPLMTDRELQLLQSFP